MQTPGKNFKHLENLTENLSSELMHADFISIKKEPEVNFRTNKQRFRYESYRGMSAVTQPMESDKGQ